MADSLDLSDVAVVDQHCHQWLRPSAVGTITPDRYRLLFTEGVDPRLAAEIPTSVYYRWTVRELARLFGCAPREEDVLAARNALGYAAFADRLMAEARIEAAVVDFKFAGRGSDTFTVAEMAAQFGEARTVGALRLESVLEELILDAADAGELEDRFRARLDRSALMAEGIVALKSIIAYRTGLAVSATRRDTAYAVFGALKAEATASGRVRIAAKPLLDYFLLIALGWAADERFPVQLHTGFGDPDVVLSTANPILLREVLQDGRYREVPLVFLHGSWPYVRDLSYLASVYPNVYLDLGLAIPFVAADLDGVVRQALALAPAAKVLYSSDGFAIPEHAWFAAVHGRRALGRVLASLIDVGALGEEDAREMAELILRGNARRLYALGEVAA